MLGQAQGLGGSGSGRVRVRVRVRVTGAGHGQCRWGGGTVLLMNFCVAGGASIGSRFSEVHVRDRKRFVPV
jgi:hypothetical protein